MASTLFIFAMMFLLCTAVKGEDNKFKVFGTEIEVPQGCLELQGNAPKGYKHYYCPEKVSEYPQENVDSLVHEMGKIVFSQDQEQEPDDRYHKDPHCAFEEERNCCTESKIEQPYVVFSDNQKKLVIQSKYFKQTFKTTRCANEDSKCFSDFGLDSFGFKTKCSTDYAYTKLFVYNSETNLMETLPVRIPISCSCDVSNEPAPENLEMFDDYKIDYNDI